MYTREQEEEIIKNTEHIVHRAKRSEAMKVKPTIHEFKEIHSFILSYIKNHKKPMYGGYAFHLRHKKIYSDELLERPDVEFYSPDPGKDIIELCDSLKKEDRYDSILVRSAVHPDTFTLSVNFQDYLDITYMPRNIYDFLGHVNVSGFRVVDDRVMVIDYLRMINDPMSSYWRFEKFIERFFVLSKHMEKSVRDARERYKSKQSGDMLRDVFSAIRETPSLLFFGFVWDRFIVQRKEGGEDTVSRNLPYIECISTDFKKDLKDVLKTLRKMFRGVYYMLHRPFFQFTGVHAVFYVNKKKILCVFSNNEMCIPLHDSRVLKNTAFVSFYYHIQMCLVSSMYQSFMNNRHLSSVYRDMARRGIVYNKELLKTKDGMLTKQFTDICEGTSVNPVTKSRTIVANNIKNKKRARLTYNPFIENDESKILDLSFQEMDGSVIKIR